MKVFDWPRANVFDGDPVGPWHEAALPGRTAFCARCFPPGRRRIGLAKDLDQFDAFLHSVGLNSDHNHVFTVENGVVHVSGTEFGYFITKHEYKNYYLRAEFKWGEGTFVPRQGQARDSGILYNIQGLNKVWPRSIEFQINEGYTGDFWMTDGAALTPIGPDGKAGERVTGPEGKVSKIDRFNKGEFKNVTAFRDPTNELETPHGEWNVVELVNRGGHVWQYVNGKLANEGIDAFPASGIILFQSQGAEVFFRNIKVCPLKYPKSYTCAGPGHSRNDPFRVCACCRAVARLLPVQKCSGGNCNVASSQKASSLRAVWNDNLHGARPERAHGCPAWACGAAWPRRGHSACTGAHSFRRNRQNTKNQRSRNRNSFGITAACRCLWVEGLNVESPELERLQLSSHSSLLRHSQSLSA